MISNDKKMCNNNSVAMTYFTTRSAPRGSSRRSNGHLAFTSHASPNRDNAQTDCYRYPHRDSHDHADTATAVAVVIVGFVPTARRPTATIARIARKITITGDSKTVVARQGSMLPRQQRRNSMVASTVNNKTACHSTRSHNIPLEVGSGHACWCYQRWAWLLKLSMERLGPI
jgi:hypothetical protein